MTDQDRIKAADKTFKAIKKWIHQYECAESNGDLAHQSAMARVISKEALDLDWELNKVLESNMGA